ncbi:MAG: DUF1570 domain-containing protein [Acidobacteria bacterium]|nr:MAG: DUF1570 domain-containing protein [Acidobacteriota bacterium]REK11510.1 MAG: DUF1570 domain-containing protein [Acidobacteriota bacterium]
MLEALQSGVGAPARIALALLAAATASTASASTASTASAEDRWRSVESENFEVLSDASPRRIADTVRELESLHAVLGRIASRPRSGPKTLVVAFADNDGFRRYSPWPDRRRVAGYFAQALLRNYIVLDLSSGAGSRSIYHEYLHEFASTNFPDVPLWFNEGLAEYYSTFRTTRGEALVGLPVEQHVAVLTQRSDGPMPLSELFAVTTSSPEYGEDRRAGLFYAQSWATVHYLLSEPGRIAEMAVFLDALQRGADVAAAFAAGFDDSLADLETQVADYVRRAEFPYLRLPLDELSRPDDRRPRPLPRADALVLLGELLANSPETLAAAEAHFQEALDLEPDLARAGAGLGWVLWQQGARSQGLALLRESVPSPGAQPAFLVGHLLLEELFESTDPIRPRPDQVAVAQEALAALEAALAIEPEWPQARIRFGLAHLYAGDPGRGIAALESARMATPTDPGISFGLSLLAAKAGRFDEAWARSQALAELLARLPRERTAGPAGPLVDLNRQLIAGFQAAAAIAAFEGGDLALAEQLVGDLDLRLDGGDAPDLLSSLDELQRALRDQRAAQVYNAAIDRARGGDRAGALAALQELMREPDLDPELRRLVREAVATLSGR